MNQARYSLHQKSYGVETNYDDESVSRALTALRDVNALPAVMIDFSHANSKKRPTLARSSLTMPPRNQGSTRNTTATKANKIIEFRC